MIFRNWVLENFPFLEDDFDALTDYELFCKMCSYVIEYSKDNKEMKAKIEEFQHYFDNLDVQEEIDNKLDEMAESGELADIISLYLNENVLHIFNSVSELSEATDLSSGSKCKTNGFYNMGDGGASNYYIRTKTELDVIDGYKIIELVNTNNLVAVFENNNAILNAHQYGIIGDGLTDYTDRIKEIFKNNCYFPAGTYIISDKISVNNHLVYGDGIGTTIFKIKDNASFTSESHVFYTSGKDSVTFRGITFNGNKSNNSTTPRTMLTFYNSTNIIVENCEVRDTYTSMMTLNGSSDVNISKCRFINSDGIVSATGPAIHANPVNNLTIDSCYCENISDHFLYITCADENLFSKNIIVSNCILNSCGANALTAGSALCFYANTRDVLVNNTIIKNSHAGIYVGQQGSYTFVPKNVTISNCLIDGVNLNALSIRGVSEDKVKNIKIDNTEIKNSPQTNIRLTYADNITVSNCSLHDSLVGIETEYTNYINICNNQIYDNSSYNVLIGRQGHTNSHVTLYDNMIYATNSGNSLYGLNMNIGDYIKVYNCDIFGNDINIYQNAVTNYSYINQIDKSSSDSNLPSVTFSDSIPNAGSYRKGDIILYNNGNTSYIGAVCTVAGTPGTWKNFGSVSS